MVNTKLLKNGLDGLYAERAYEIEKKTIVMYSETSDLLEVQEQLNQWEKIGKIKIIKPIIECKEMEKCIRLLAWLNPRNPDGSPIKMGL